MQDSNIRLLAGGLRLLINNTTKLSQHKKQTMTNLVRRIQSLNLRTLAGALRLLRKNLNEYIKSHTEAFYIEERTRRLKKKVLYKMTDKAHNLSDASFQKLRQFSSDRTKKIKSIASRLFDSNLHMQAMGLKKLRSNSSRVFNIQKAFALRLLNSTICQMGEGLRSLREFSYMQNLSKKKIEDKLRGITLRILNSNLRLLGGS